MALQAQLWSLNALSTELDRDRRSLARRLEDLTPDEQVKHAGRQIKRWRLRRVLAHLDAQTTTVLDLNQERARLAKIQAEKIEFEVARLRGSLLDADAVERALSRVIVDLRTRLLALPTKAAPLLMGCRTIPRLKDELERQVHDALRELADTDVTRYLVELGDEQTAPAAEDDNKPVGGRAAHPKSGRKRRARRVANR